MGRPALYMSMALDGFTAGPGDDRDNRSGTKGQRLHEWLGDGGEDASGYWPSDEPGRTVFDQPDHVELQLVRILESPGSLHLRYEVRYE